MDQRKYKLIIVSLTTQHNIQTVELLTQFNNKLATECWCPLDTSTVYLECNELTIIQIIITLRHQAKWKYNFHVSAIQTNDQIREFSMYINI